MAAIDLSQLPPPQIVDVPDFETLLAERKASFVALYPADQQDTVRHTLALESEPITKQLQESTYREALLRQRINEAAQAVMVAYSNGNDLEQLAANYNVKRLAVTPADDNAVSVVLATRKYVDDKTLELRVYVDDQMAKHHAAADPHTQYAPKASPTLIGTPKAPTAAAGNNTTQLATTAFVQAAIAALVNSSPGALDTLNELAAALGNDPNFATTMTNALAGKMDKAANGADIADVAAFLNNLALGAGSALPVGGPIPWPLAAAPAGWLKCNGASFTAVQYPKLARAYPGLKLPDLRGEFLRGWDDGRGVDSGRGLLSLQAGMIERHRHYVVENTVYDQTEEWDIGAIVKSTYTQGKGLDAGSPGSLIAAPTLQRGVLVTLVVLKPARVTLHLTTS